MKRMNQFFYWCLCLFFVSFFFHCQERKLITSAEPLESEILDLTIVGFKKTNFQKETRDFENIFLVGRKFNFTTYLEKKNNPLDEITWQSGDKSILEIEDNGTATMKKVGVTTLKATSVFNSKISHSVMLSINSAERNFIQLKVYDIDSTAAKINFPPNTVAGISFYLTYDYWTNDLKKIKENSFWQYNLKTDGNSSDHAVTSLKKKSAVFGYFVLDNKVLQKNFFVTSPELYYDANFSFSVEDDKWLDLSINKNNAFFSNGNWTYDRNANIYRNKTNAFIAFKEVNNANGFIQQIDAGKFRDFTPFMGHHTEDKLKSGKDGNWVNADFTPASPYRSGAFFIDGERKNFEDFIRSSKIHIYGLRMVNSGIKISQTRASVNTLRAWMGSFKRIIIYKEISLEEMQKINKLLQNFVQTTFP